MDFGMLKWMYKENLLMYVSDMMVVSVFWIILNDVNSKITNLLLCMKKKYVYYS